MPSGYVIADVEVSDPERYKGYTALSPGAIAAAGGEFVVRGGRHETLEGDWTPGRVVVVKFPSLDSALYVAARAQRAGATSKFNLIVVEGA